MNSLFALGFTLVSISAFAAPKIDPGTYSVDPAHSKVGFEVSHLVISTVEGRFNAVTGSITMGIKNLMHLFTHLHYVRQTTTATNT
jgi:polyisoprenoid-binding protein YceI